MNSQKLLMGAALVSLPLIVGGLALANAQKSPRAETQQTSEQAYVCPLTGEELPCPNCCPLSK